MSERQPRVSKQFRGGNPVFIYDGAAGEFAEFPTVEKLDAYLKAMDVTAVWMGVPGDCPKSTNVVLPDAP